MSLEIIFKITSIGTVCLLSWAAACYYIFGSLVVLEHQKHSAKYFKYFFIILGFAFLSFALSTLITSPITIAMNNLLYLTSFYYMHLGFSSLNGRSLEAELKNRRRFQLIVVAVLIINPLCFYALFDSHVIRTMVIISFASYFCINCLKCIEKNEHSPGSMASIYSLITCIFVMFIMFSVLLVTGSSLYYLATLMVSQSLVVILLFGATLVLFLSDASAKHQKDACTDFMTGLYNRRYLHNRLKEIIFTTQRHLTPVSIAMIDLDYFKQINDTYGHDAGDETLKQIAKVIKGIVRNSDLAARFGGEEFCILLPYTDAKGASLLCERIRETIETLEIQINEHSFQLTASFGIAVVELNLTPDQIIKNADLALYQSKSTGRNKISMYDEPQMQEVAENPAL